MIRWAPPTRRDLCHKAKVQVLLLKRKQKWLQHLLKKKLLNRIRMRDKLTKT